MALGSVSDPNGPCGQGKGVGYDSWTPPASVSPFGTSLSPHPTLCPNPTVRRSALSRAPWSSGIESVHVTHPNCGRTIVFADSTGTTGIDLTPCWMADPPSTRCLPRTSPMGLYTEVGRRRWAGTRNARVSRRHRSVLYLVRLVQCIAVTWPRCTRTGVLLRIGVLDTLCVHVTALGFS